MFELKVTGRTPISIWKKLNPWWWLWNDDDQIPDQWYMPGANYYWRQICWWFRNPCANFFQYVVGVQDRNYTLVGNPQPDLGMATMKDRGSSGWLWHFVVFNNGFGLPFVSYSGAVVFYLGWRPMGGLGFKLVKG